MVLGKLPVPGRPTIWIIVGQGPTTLAVGAGGGCLDIFTLIYPFFPLSPSLWETARYRLKYCLKGPLNPKQPTNLYNSLNSIKYGKNNIVPVLVQLIFTCIVANNLRVVTVGWLVVLGLTVGRKRIERIEESKNVQTAPTRAVGPCPTVSKL